MTSQEIVFDMKKKQAELERFTKSLGGENALKKLPEEAVEKLFETFLFRQSRK